MHQTRNETITKLPIRRKGTKYIARALHAHKNAVPVVIAVRDMLKLAKTLKEVQHMIKNKALKINGRVVEDYRDSIKLFNIFEADKHYELTLLPTGKFAFKDTKNSSTRLCKVTGKRLVNAGMIQLNLHDGSNILSKDKITVGDSLYLDLTSKIKNHVTLDAGKEVFIFSGKYQGQSGKVQKIEDNRAYIKFKEGSAVLNKKQLVAI